MFFKSNDKNGNVSAIAISCSCECEMLTAAVTPDNCILISAYSSSWYCYQNFDIMWTKIRYITDRIKGKKKGKQIIMDAVVTKDELAEFVAAGKEMLGCKDAGYNQDAASARYITSGYSHLAAEPLSEHGDEWLLEIRSDMNLSMMLKGNLFRSFEIYMKKDEWTEFLNRVEKRMRKCK